MEHYDNLNRRQLNRLIAEASIVTVRAMLHPDDSIYLRVSKSELLEQMGPAREDTVVEYTAMVDKNGVLYIG